MTLTTEFEHATNGLGATDGEAPTLATTAPTGPRMPIRTAWVDLPDEYAGFRVLLWKNYPRRLNDDLASGEQERMRAALLQVVLEHNSWIDTNGDPFPLANDPEFWDVIPDELAAAVIILLTLQPGKLAMTLRARDTR